MFQAAIQRAEDKTQTMQARANAIAELTAAGTLPDLLSTGGDDVQAQLDKISASGSVDADLAALKTRLGQGAPAPAVLGEHTESPGMVVRVQGNGQYRLAQPDIDELHDLDRRLADAVVARDEQGFHGLLSQLTNLVQTKGLGIGPDELVTSATILPPSTLTVKEAKTLLHDDSLLKSATPSPSPKGSG